MKEPINKDLEIAVLGAMLNDEKARYDIISEINEEFFHDDDIRSVFVRTCYMTDEHKLTARMVLEKTEQPKEKSIIRTADSVYVDYDHFKRQFEDFKELYKLRMLYQSLNKAMNQVAAGASSEEISEMLTEKMSNLFVEDDQEYMIDPKERAPQMVEEIEERFNNPETAYGIRFSVERGDKVLGFPSVDESILGAHPGDLIMIGAETGVGKTALGINVARLFSYFQDYSGYYFNTEMRKTEIEGRILAPVAGVSVKEWTGKIEGTAEERLRKKEVMKSVARSYGEKKIATSRIPQLTVSKIKALSRRWRIRKKELDYIIVDYVQRLQDRPNYGEQEHDRLTRIAMRLKELGVELGVPVIILAQLNHEGHVQGAKAMRNECDVVLYLKPIEPNDIEHINAKIPHNAKRVNYKLEKNKVRRDDDPYPIYVNFDKKRQFINEIL